MTALESPLPEQDRHRARARMLRALRWRAADPAPPRDEKPALAASGPLPDLAGHAEPVVTLGRIIAFVAMVVGMFMAILDIQIVAASLPQIQAGLAASRDEVSWVQTSYLIAEVVMIPLAGYLSRWLGSRPTFLMAAIGFTGFSVLAGLAQSMNQMILARTFQGFFGGALIPTVFALAFTAFPERHRTLTTVVVSLIATLAPTIGPTIGGYITEAASWHWLFFVNVVPGIAIVLIVLRFADFDKGDARLSRGIDWIGLATMAIFLGCLQYFLEEGPRNDWFDDRAVLIAATASGLGCVVFFWRSLTYSNPIVDLKAFGNGNFAIGSALQFIVGAGLYGSVFLRPLFLAEIRQFGAIDIGIVMLGTGLAMFLAAPVSGQLSERIDPRLQMAGGMLLAAWGFHDMSRLTPEWGFAEMFWPQIWSGAGIMIAMIPATRVAMATLSPERIKSASSLYQLVRNIGGAVALAALVQLLSDRGDFHRLRLGEALAPDNLAAANFLETLTFRDEQLGIANPENGALQQLGGLIARDASTMAFADSFTLLAYAFAVGAMLTLVIGRVRTGPGSMPAGH